MRTRTVEVREGENMGPVNWFHPTAKDMPDIWLQAEEKPEEFLFNGRQIVAICMYDGWPYWIPTPAICFIGPMNSAEWNFFNSYGVTSRSITRRAVAQGGSARRAEIEGQTGHGSEDTPADPRETVIIELRSAIMSGDRRVTALLNDLPADRRALITDADVKELKEAQRAIEQERKTQ